MQFRYSYPAENTEENVPAGGDPLEFTPQLVGYTSLEPKNGKMGVWYGFHCDSISYHPYGRAARPELATTLSYFAELKDDQFYYHDWENPNEPGPLYCGPSLFFQVVKEDGTVYTVGFVPHKLPEELRGLYSAMNYNLWKMSNGQQVTDASATQGDKFLKVIQDKFYKPDTMPPPNLPLPPPPVRATVKYTPPAAEG